MPAQQNVAAGNVTEGPGSILYSPRDTAVVTVTALASPAPSATSFAVSAADAALIHEGDRIQLASATPTYLAPELSVAARVISKSSDAEPVITCTALSGAPPTSAGGVRIIWHNVGATRGGVRMEGSAEQSPIRVDQSRAAVAYSDGDIDVKLFAPMAESTLANYALAMGHAKPTSATVLQINAADASRTDRWAFIGPGPGSTQVYGVIPKGKSMGRAVWNAVRGETPLFDLEITAVQDTTSTPDLLDVTLV